MPGPIQTIKEPTLLAPQWPKRYKKAIKSSENNFNFFQFLDYTKSQGNDLSTPHLPGFPGLKPGDRWVICILRWHEAQKAGYAPLLKLKATNQKALEYVDLELLEEFDDNKFWPKKKIHMKKFDKLW